MVWNIEDSVIFDDFRPDVFKLRTLMSELNYNVMSGLATSWKKYFVKITLKYSK